MGSIRLAPAIAALLVAVACGGSGQGVPGRTATDAGDGGGEPSAAAPPGPSAPAVAKVLDFKAPNLAGGQVVGSEFAGRDLAIWFWAPW